MVENKNLIIIGVIILIGFLVLQGEPIFEEFSTFQPPETIETGFGHERVCLSSLQLTNDFLGYSISNTGSTLNVKRGGIVLFNAVGDYEDNYILVEHRCNYPDWQDIWTRVYSSNFVNLVNPTVEITEKSVEFWEGSNNNDLILGFISPLSFGNVILDYKFYLPETTEGIRPEREFKKNIQINEGLNEFTINIPQEYVIGDYAIDIRIYSIQERSWGIPRLIIDYPTKIDIFDPIRKEFLIVPRPIFLIKELGETCPDLYKESTTTEHTIICVRDDLKDLPCARLGCPVTEDYTYACGSDGLCSEKLFQAFNCKSDLDCKSLGLDKCHTDTGVCYEEKIFVELMQCSQDSDCGTPCYGITPKCISNKCEWSGECIIEEIPQGVSLVNFKVIEVSSGTFSLEYPKLVEKGVLIVSLPLDTVYDPDEEIDYLDIELNINNELKLPIRMSRLQNSFSTTQELNFRRDFFRSSGNTITVKRGGKNIGFNLKLYERHLCEKDTDVYCPITKSVGICIDYLPVCEGVKSTEDSEVVGTTETIDGGESPSTGTILLIIGGLGILFYLTKR